MFFWLPYFSPKSLGFFFIPLLVCFRVISSQLLIEFSFIVLECPVLSVLFYHLSISLPSFARTFCFISSSCIVNFSCFLFSFLFLITPSYFLCFIILACFCRFVIYFSSHNFHPGFDFSFVLFVSALTVLDSMFLNNGMVVFSQFKILFKFPRLNFHSCESVCSGLFGCAVFGCVGLPFSKIFG